MLPEKSTRINTMHRCPSPRRAHCAVLRIYSNLSMMALVNSVVLDEPPRSGVR